MQVQNRQHVSRQYSSNYNIGFNIIVFLLLFFFSVQEAMRLIFGLLETIKEDVHGLKRQCALGDNDSLGKLFLLANFFGITEQFGDHSTEWNQFQVSGKVVFFSCFFYKYLNIITSNLFVLIGIIRLNW